MVEHDLLVAVEDLLGLIVGFGIFDLFEILDVDLLPHSRAMRNW